MCPQSRNGLSVCTTPLNWAMGEAYTQGMVSQLLGGGQEPSAGKLASFFAVPAHAQVTEPKKKTKPKKEKAAAPPAKKAGSSPAKKKVRVKAHEKNQSGQTGFCAQPAASSEGFNPPPGVVHVALTEPSEKAGRKRKKSEIDDEDGEDGDDDSQNKKGIKEDKRPRRDRLKKASEKRTIFIGNVPLRTNKKKLTRLFKQFGEIESVRFRCAPVGDPTMKKRVAVITKEFHEKRHNISAYICFKEEEAAKEAVTLNGHLIDDFHLRVDLAKPELKNLNKRSVFVGNLPFAIEEESIREHFQDCGEIENVRVVRDRKTNLGKGFCYILFKSADSVSLALQLKNSELQKRQLRVQRCVDPAQKDAQGKKMKKAADRKQTNTDQKAKTRQTNKDQKIKRKKKTMWQPTNASATQVYQSHKTALKKKQRKVEKKKKKKSKADEVSRVLGPLQQPPENFVRSRGAGKPKPKRKDLKGGKKGKRGGR
ncbi:RNA-binding protein 34-like isoform X2 [Babylonia areolata]|uniref:RNA-binding protein 34-like isoform X2 n=1 Tax=Babylonia areolata TaxID=304850 RepID=UPI003FD1135D